LLKLNLKEEKNFTEVVYKCIIRGEEWFDPNTIDKAVSINDEKYLLGFLLTIQYKGIKSFHGFNFTKNREWEAIAIAREYIKKENLIYSAGNKEGTKRILERLGFKRILESNNEFVMEKTPTIAS